MGPRTGPRPASSTPRAQGGPGSWGSFCSGVVVVEGEDEGEDAGGRRDGGTGEK